MLVGIAAFCTLAENAREYPISEPKRNDFILGGKDWGVAKAEDPGAGQHLLPDYTQRP